MRVHHYNPESEHQFSQKKWILSMPKKSKKVKSHTKSTLVILSEGTVHYKFVPPDQTVYQH